MIRTHRTAWDWVACTALACVGCVTLPDFQAPTPTAHVNPAVDSNGSSSPTPTGGATTGGTPTARTSYLHQVDGNISDATLAAVTLHGIGWAGFESGSMLSLPTNPSRLGSDVATVMQRMHLLGFNLVHLSFSFAQLYNTDGSRVMNANSVKVPCAGSSSASAIISSVTVPAAHYGPPANTPLLSNAPAASAGMCNDYLPDLGHPVVERLAAIVDIFTRNGIYVLLDESIDRDPALVGDPTGFVNNWSKLATDLIQFGGTYEGITQPSCTSDPNNTSLALCHNTILGIMNNVERLHLNLSWEPNSVYPLAGGHQLYKGAMEALSTAMPRAMFVVPGAYQFGYSTTFNVGVNATTTNFPALIGPASIASASSFFEDMLNSSLESQMLFGFTAFGPTSDTWLMQFVPDMEAKVANDFDASFGGLSSMGVVDAQQVAHLFPVMPVALGGNAGDPNDAVFLDSMQTYMASHMMNNFIWWCWNGQNNTASGLVDASTYIAVNPDIINYLKQLGLTPPS